MAVKQGLATVHFWISPDKLLFETMQDTEGNAGYKIKDELWPKTRTGLGDLSNIPQLLIGLFKLATDTDNADFIFSQKQSLFWLAGLEDEDPDTAFLALERLPIQ